MTELDSQFTPPSGLYIYGETLQNMSLEQYTRFVVKLGQAGLHVAIPGVGEIDTVRQLGEFNASDVVPEEMPDVYLLSKPEIRHLALARGFISSHVTRGLNIVNTNGRYFPETEEAICRSRVYVGRSALGYYPPDLMTEDSAVLQSEGIDIADGFTLDGLVRRYNKGGGNYDWDYRLYEIGLRLSKKSRLDIVSLHRYVASPVFADERNVGPAVIDTMSRLCIQLLAERQ